MTGYERERFGTAWTDDTEAPFGHNGCDTRNDVLRRDISRPVLAAGTAGCVVLSGVLDDPYTGGQIHFVRGPLSAQVQIDHVVALGDAWQTGAQGWSPNTRAQFANDPLNLLAVDGPANEQKGDSDAASWLPPARAFWCRYVARQTAVKAKYGLWMTAAEKAAIKEILVSRCPAEPLPREPGRLRPPGPITVSRATGGSSSPRAGSPTTSGSGSSSGGSGRCEPGYSPCLPVVADLDCGDIADSLKPIRVTGDDPYRLDADGDGWGCEP